MKKYRTFLKESVIYDNEYRYKSEKYLADLLRQKISEEFDKINPEHPVREEDPYSEEIWEEEVDYEELPQIIIDVMDEFNYDFEWRYEPFNFVKDTALHFVNYNIMDDGDVSFEDNKLVPPKNVNNSYFHENITKVGASLYYLERLGYITPCAIVLYERKGNTVLAKCESFTESMIKLKEIRNNMKNDNLRCKVDCCILLGELSIYTIPIVPV